MPVPPKKPSSPHGHKAFPGYDNMTFQVSSAYNTILIHDFGFSDETAARLLTWSKVVLYLTGEQ